MLKTVQKTFQVLDAFTPEQPEWRLTDLAVQLKTPKTTLHPLLTSLVDEGCLEQTAERRYRLGIRALALGRAKRRQDTLMTQVHFALRDLSNACLGCALYGVLQDDRIVIADYEVVRHIYAFMSQRVSNDTSLPLHASALSKVLLAQLSDRALDRILATHSFERFTAATLTSADALKAEIEVVRRQGYAVSCEEQYPGLCSVAAPLSGSSNQGISSIGGMGLVCPTSQFNRCKDDYRYTVLAACREVSREAVTSTVS